MSDSAVAASSVLGELNTSAGPRSWRTTFDAGRLARHLVACPARACAPHGDESLAFAERGLAAAPSFVLASAPRDKPDAAWTSRALIPQRWRSSSSSVKSPGRMCRTSTMDGDYGAAPCGNLG
jgi:hypothetical protein